MTSCSNTVGAECNTYSCDQGFQKNGAVQSLMCSASGSWNYDISIFCPSLSSGKSYGAVQSLTYSASGSQNDLYSRKESLHFSNHYYGLCVLSIKVRKTMRIRKRYNQLPHLTQDITWESNKNTTNITNKLQEVSPVPAGDHKVAMNRFESMRNTRHKNTNDPQKVAKLALIRFGRHPTAKWMIN